MSFSSAGDEELVETIVQHLKSQGIFDHFRRECLADSDTKPSYQNLRQRIEGHVSKFLSQQKWNQSLNKNQLRERLRRQINESGMLKYGIEHLVDQVVNPKINSLFFPKIESVVKEFLGIHDTPPFEIKTEDNDNMPFDENKDPLNEEIQKIDIKVEPNFESKTESEEPQPMDIATDSELSNNSNDIQNVNEIIEQNTLKQSPNDSDDYGMSWPTPPKPEMLTPERTENNSESVTAPLIKQEYVEPKITIKEEILLESVITVEKHIEEDNDNSKIKIFQSNIKEESKELKITSVSFADKPKLKDKLKSKDNSTSEYDSKSEQKSDKKDNEEEHYLSDVSSVHTSDLSDFDDEISISSGEEEETKKKKISLKVVKEITSSALSKDDKSQDSITEKSIVKTEKINVKEDPKLDSKRRRKINPKYASEDYSSIFSDKRQLRSNSSREDAEESENSLHSNSSFQMSSEKVKITKSDDCEIKPIEERSRRKRNIVSDVEINKESDDSNQYNKPSKIGRKKSDDCNLDSAARSSSRASIESKSSTMSESTQESMNSTGKKRRISKTRVEAQAQQRYDASDLYKPRPVISSRRMRIPNPPDTQSNTESSVNFVIHDLSK